MNLEVLTALPGKMKQLMAMPQPSRGELMDAAEVVASQPERVTELIGFIVSCNDVGMIRKMVVWEVKHGPLVKGKGGA